MKVKIDGDTLANNISELLFRNFPNRTFVVDVSGRNMAQSFMEWRLNMPPEEIELYVFMGRLIRRIHDEYKRVEELRPMEVTVTIWAVARNGAEQVGSLD
jgi:hypothetical protein